MVIITNGQTTVCFREKQGVRAGDLFMSFKSIFQDVRSAMDHVHLHGDLQNETVAVREFIHLFFV